MLNKNRFGSEVLNFKPTTSTRSRASQATSTEMNGNISKTTFSRYHRPPWPAACHWSPSYFPLQKDTSHFIYTIALFENVFHTYQYEFSDAVKELFFWKLLCPPPGTLQPTWSLRSIWFWSALFSYVLFFHAKSNIFYLVWLSSSAALHC